MDGPLPGSPFWTEPVMQVGNPGNATNFISATFCPIGAAAGGAAASCALATPATDKTPHTTSAHAAMLRIFIPLPPSLCLLRCLSRGRRLGPCVARLIDAELSASRQCHPRQRSPAQVLHRRA